ITPSENNKYVLRNAQTGSVLSVFGTKYPILDHEEITIPIIRRAAPHIENEKLINLNETDNLCKVMYIAPTKALTAEIVKKLGDRLKWLDVK
ncbi:3645_t:CDS:2, partial [Funneliformis geosporum]